jgi:hypothetical protein
MAAGASVSTAQAAIGLAKNYLYVGHSTRTTCRATLGGIGAMSTATGNAIRGNASRGNAPIMATRSRHIL